MEEKYNICMTVGTCQTMEPVSIFLILAIQGPIMSHDSP